MLNQLALTFKKAGEQANIPFKITPHVLRATTVTYLKQQGFSDSDIMRVTRGMQVQPLFMLMTRDLELIMRVRK